MENLLFLGVPILKHIRVLLSQFLRSVCMAQYAWLIKLRSVCNDLNTFTLTFNVKGLILLLCKYLKNIYYNIPLFTLLQVENKIFVSHDVTST